MEDIRKTLTETIKRERKERGITLVHLSELTGITYTQLRNIENDGNPRAGTIEAIFNALGLEIQIKSDSKWKQEE